MARPRLEVLDKQEVEEVHVNSLDVLARVGVKIDHEEALRLLHSFGADVDFGKKIAKIPEHMVREAIKKTPSCVRLYYRDGKRYLDLYGWNSYFVLGSTAYYYIDWKTNDIRRPLSRDLADVVMVADFLPDIDMVSTALVPSDIPDVIADRWRMYIAIKYSVKPIDTGAFTIEGIPDAVKLMAVLLGEENIGKKSFMIFAACPSPPLKWSNLVVQNVMDCARYGIPIHIVPMPQTGGTAPATLAGAIVQANAEFLSGLVIAQLTKPGIPVVYSGSPVVLDMRYGTACTGYVEVLLMASAFSQLAKFYGVPSASYTMVSDAKIVDMQATLESAFGAIVSVLTGINMVIGAGMLLEENGISLTKLVVDNDIAGMAKRFAKGITVDAESIAKKVIEEVGPGGLFLKHRHTREYWFKEHYIPKLLDKRTMSMWKKHGSKDLGTVAKEYVEKILKEHRPEQLTPDVEKELSKAMYEIARRYNIEKLPEV